MQQYTGHSSLPIQVRKICIMFKRCKIPGVTCELILCRAGPAKKAELQHHGRQFKLEQKSNVDWTHGKAVGGVHIFRQLMTFVYVCGLAPASSLSPAGNS